MKLAIPYVIYTITNLFYSIRHLDGERMTFLAAHWRAVDAKVERAKEFKKIEEFAKNCRKSKHKL